MSTVSGTASASTSVAQVQAETQSALQEAAQSIISGATGNSSLDVSSLVTALVASKTAGTEAALTTEATNDNTQISALGKLSAALSALQVDLAPLYGGGLLTAFTATATGGTGLTATAGAGAVASTYSVDVSQIATAQSVTSKAFNTTDAGALGTGTLTVGVGSNSMTINVTSSNDTLSDIASAINTANNNPGISASVITGSDGTHLVLNSKSTGAASTINVTVSNAASSTSPLNSLGVTTTAASDSTAGSTSTISTGNGWTQSAYAQDAEFTINGTAATSSTNTVTTALTGVTLNLTADAIDSTGSKPQTLTVAADTTTQATDIENFVSEYNSVVSTIASLTAFDSTQSAGSQGGPLLGDTTTNIIQNALGNIVSSSVTSGGVSATLADVGISLNADGTLTLDTSTLTTALQNDPNQVSTLFNLTNGVGAQLNNSINTFASTGGILDQRTAVYSADLTNVKTQATALTAYSSQLTTQYTNEFTALDSLMATTENDTQYLTQLFGGANSAGALASGKS
ncbi:flagellar filament capping protein FliD [Paraburkholderia sp. DHOC27]|uniref:flagellar filament capping protein FliD n=1 Tax=Paraburkholderia sp. DHOC27 TaxID=2303330 RepID=UPI000E3BA192|nr:flagellar filament capping protein FliD [Paraburkholderia sp. DHOC27]RFU47467.1 flagellar hook protein FliD [Paraburkholderia sp. DHOC27]